MTDNVPVPFGARRGDTKIFARVPMFDQMLQASRDLVGTLGWLREEVDKADTLCTSLEGICAQMEQSKVLETASRHTTLAVARLRTQVTRINEWCSQLELLTTELHVRDEAGEEDMKMPRVFSLPVVGRDAKG